MLWRLLTIGVLLGGWVPCGATDADRAVAEWVLHVGGSVVLEGTTRPIWDAADLPASDFQLHTVNLSTSLIPPADLKRLGALPHLKDLYLSGRTWHNVPVKVAADSLKLLEGLTSLERFILTLPVQVEIPIEDPAIANLAPLTHLQQLRLAQTRIKGRTLAAFTEMRSLDLTNTRLDDQGMRSLQGMTHLQKLYAHDALITDEGLQYIRNLHELTELDLYNTRITDAGLVYLKGLTNLRKLNLLGASVTDAGLDQLTGLTKLTELNLYRTQITNSGLEKLKAFQGLREIDVRYTRITRGGLAAFAAANPRCQVAFLDASVGPSETRAAGPSVAGKGTAAITRWVQARGGAAVVEAGRIREVSLASTAITDADLANLRGLDLRKLDLSFTEVSDVGLQTLGVAEHCPLAEIYLANTTVSDAGLKSLRSCQSLRKLGLAYTLVRGDGLDALPAAITDLDLTGLSFSAEGLSRIARFTGLQHLDLKYSDIDDTGLVHLQNLSNLTRLDLTGTDLGDAGLKSLRSLSRLSELSLNYGRFTDAGLAEIGGLQNLTRLDLVRTRTSDKSLEMLSGLKHLTSLNLDYTSVSDKGLPYLAEMRQLTRLRLDSAAVTDAGVEILKSLQELKTLNLYHTLVTDRGIETLKSALPNCKLLWDRGSNLPTRRGS